MSFLPFIHVLIFSVAHTTLTTSITKLLEQNISGQQQEHHQNDCNNWDESIAFVWGHDDSAAQPQ
jgi:hypothetical protein